MAKDTQYDILKQLRNEFGSTCAPLKDALESFKNCTEEIDARVETGCSIILNHFPRCSKPYLESFRSCLPPKSREVPDFLFQSFESVVSHVCTRDGEHIFEYVNRCLHKFSNHTVTCEALVEAKLKEYEVTPPTKSELCEVVETMGVCLNKHLEYSCKSNVTKESAMGAFEAIVAPCRATVVNGTE